MKVLVFTLLLIGTTFATQLLTPDDLQDLFIRYAKKELSQVEVDILVNVLKVYYSEPPLSVDGSVSDARLNLECLICRSGISALFELVRNEASDKELIEAASIMCSSLGILTSSGCLGVIELNAPILTYIIRNAPEATPATMCGLLLQNAGSDVCNYNDPRFDWQVELPERFESSEESNEQPSYYMHKEVPLISNKT